MAATRIPVEGVGDASRQLADRLQENRAGKPVGVYSICSANRFVLEAGMLQAMRDDSSLLIESTSSQVNQFGGYTGQTPSQFVTFVKELASGIGLPAERILFGGDHLGPNPWRNEDPTLAMQKAAKLVRDCVRAGYAKIHLDASMHLAGDPGDPHQPLAEEIVSERAAELCKAAEDEHAKVGDKSSLPLYVIGTEVPIPGGELSDSHAPKVTTSGDAERTVEMARSAFEDRGLLSAWERVMATVVQPGVEFGDAEVFPYRPEKTRELSRLVETKWHGVFEAHSTDYQTHTALREMVRDHFAILKVGPWLTFTFREAVFALAAIEEECLGSRKHVTKSRVRESLERAMLARPEYWKGYFHGDEEALRFARKYSLSDRARYYWPHPDVAAALQLLLNNLTLYPPPVALLGQFMPSQAARVLDHELSCDPCNVIRDRILEVIDHYAAACGMGVPQ
ncbi:MAG TPA: class II D-tagatose-bisphosphate aldolase, non-catalytic subunit [Terriglobales bacterium]|nr:class II D-tagatose-bisphosphate aldolase, non-catalytic subunit [Terriglobales bacterium]